METDVELYRIIPVPSNLGLFDASRYPNPQRVEYRHHPAYENLTKSSLTRRISSTAFFLGSLGPLLIKRLIKFELIPNEVRSARGLTGRVRFALRAVTNVLTLARPARRPRSSSPIYTSLTERGCSVLLMPERELAAIQQLAAPVLNLLEAQRARTTKPRKFEESRLSADRTSAAELFEEIEALFVRSGILAAAEAYLGRKARLVDVNPQINDPTDNFWREIFPDAPSSRDSKSAYFHRDASGGDLKAIIYLTDVTEKNGPFAYVVGSHRLGISRFDNLICEANDHNGLSATHLDARRRFAALPRRFRQKGSFGNDLADDSGASREILRNAWSITGPKGSIVLFDTKGIHRGGMVVEGERRVITCVIG